MIFRSLAALALLGTALSGCASIVKGSSQDIQLSSGDVSGAECKLTNTRGEWNATTPAKVTVKRSKSALQVHCAKDGYQDGMQVANSGFESWTLGNILIGGLIGIGIDAGTGAINEYPDMVQVPMTPNRTTSNAAPAGGSAPSKSSAAPSS